MNRRSLSAALLLCVLAQPAAAASPGGPVIDGVVGEAEWQGAQREPMEGGGEVLLLRRGDTLFVALLPKDKGTASLCLGDANRVSVLHASAALGTAVYEKKNATWSLVNGFEYVVRDSPRTGAPAAEQKTKHLSEQGWLANPDHRGTSPREFEIHLRDGWSWLGVAMLDFTVEPNTVSHWPKQIADDCRALRLVQGWTDPALQFAPETWMKLR